MLLTSIKNKIVLTAMGLCLSMGLTAEAVAKEYNVSREDQDLFSYNSHLKAGTAIREGYFKSGILPITVEEIYLDQKGKKQKRNYVYAVLALNLFRRAKYRCFEY